MTSQSTNTAAAYTTSENSNVLFCEGGLSYQPAPPTEQQLLQQGGTPVIAQAEVASTCASELASAAATGAGAEDFEAPHLHQRQAVSICVV